MTTRLIMGLVVGGALGYLAYRFIGCSAGTCPLTSNPWVSAICGMIAGALLAGAGR